MTNDKNALLADGGTGVYAGGVRAKGGWVCANNLSLASDRKAFLADTHAVAQLARVGQIGVRVSVRRAVMPPKVLLPHNARVRGSRRPNKSSCNNARHTHTAKASNQKGQSSTPKPSCNNARVTPKRATEAYSSHPY